jgi:hypothetical protein
VPTTVIRMLRPAPLLAALAVSFGCAGAADAPPVQLVEHPGSFVVSNEQGQWTVRTICRTGRRLTVGPGYVSRLVSRDGTVLVDDWLPRGTLNDPRFGGLGAFGWHHARGRPGRLRFHGRNAWEISSRVCARPNGGFGVVRSTVAEAPAVDGDAVTFAIDVFFSDMFTYPKPLLSVRYRYRFEPSLVRTWVDVRPLCAGGRCGRTRMRAFVKEPKLVAHARNVFSTMSVYDATGTRVCAGDPAGPATGPILETTQCDTPSRDRLRFEPCAPDCLEVRARASERQPWVGASSGLDGWARSAARRPSAYRRDTPSVDGVVWPCHGGNPRDARQRRWELAGRRAGPLGALFPAWEGGRGGYDCEPLARTFGAHGERWTAYLEYALVR